MKRLLAAGSALAAAAAVAVPAAAQARPAPATGSATITVSPAQHHQAVDGFGFAEAFRESVVTALPAAEQQQLESLLFSTSSGAGMSIVRFGLGGGDANTGSVADQLWLGEAAQRYGVHQFYADSWSAPGKMKTNGSLINGGSLCGSPGETCAVGDRRAAYARLLASQAAGFARHGLPLQAIDFINEPEIGPAYASMLMTPAQAADFVPYLGRALHAAHLRTKVACCDAEGWTDGAAYTSAVLGDPAAARYVSLITSHGYTAAPTVPLTSARPVWESEWANFDPWDPAWDDGTPGDGMTWAQDISAAFTQAGAGAFFYWWGASASTANSGLIQFAGPTVNLSARYWAFTAFSRFIRPGAVRVGARASDPGVQVSAYRNHAGSLVIEAINSGTSEEQVTLRVPGCTAGLGSAAGYLTDAGDSLAPQPAPAGGQAALPARSLSTWVIGRPGCDHAHT
jgi:O-glycosyl hydrolase